MKSMNTKTLGMKSISPVKLNQVRLARHASGFTLMEIIVVVILIGGIVAFAATRILGGSDRAKFNLAKAEIETLASKIDQYHQDTGALPPSLDALVTQPSGVSTWLGPYAKPEELKDPWQHPLVYKVPGDGAPFSLTCLGKDGQPGGTSTDQDIVHQ